MLDKAIEKLDKEIESQKSKNSYVAVIGEYLIHYVTRHPNEAEKILNDSKTISGALAAMKAEARKKAQAGFAMISDDEGYGIVLKYFGINPTNTEYPTPKIIFCNKKSAKSIDIDLEDLF